MNTILKYNICVIFNCNTSFYFFVAAVAGTVVKKLLVSDDIIPTSAFSVLMFCSRPDSTVSSLVTESEVNDIEPNNDEAYDIAPAAPAPNTRWACDTRDKTLLLSMMGVLLVFFIRVVSVEMVVITVRLSILAVGYNVSGNKFRRGKVIDVCKGTLVVEVTTSGSRTA